MVRITGLREDKHGVFGLDLGLFGGLFIEPNTRASERGPDYHLCRGDSRLTGLWLRTTGSGLQYLEIQLGLGRLLIFKNQAANGDNEPDWVVYRAPTREASQRARAINEVKS